MNQRKKVLPSGRHKFTLFSFSFSLFLSLSSSLHILWLFPNVSWHVETKWKDGDGAGCSSQTQNTCRWRKPISQSAADKAFIVKSWRVLRQRTDRTHLSLPLPVKVKARWSFSFQLHANIYQEGSSCKEGGHPPKKTLGLILMIVHMSVMITSFLKEL